MPFSVRQISRRTKKSVVSVERSPAICHPHSALTLKLSWGSAALITFYYNLWALEQICKLRPARATFLSLHLGITEDPLFKVTSSCMGSVIKRQKTINHYWSKRIYISKPFIGYFYRKHTKRIFYNIFLFYLHGLHHFW